MTKREQSAKNDGLTYADAGVDIDAGNAFIDVIAPLAARTRRAGVIGEIGGFGGLFDLKAAGFTDPVLVAANDGVGTKVKIAIDTGRHDSIGIDLGNLELPPVFGWIAKQGGVAPKELLRTFNCGAGLAIIATSGEADAVLSSLAQSGETAFPFGEVEARAGAQAVRFTGDLGLAP